MHRLVMWSGPQRASLALMRSFDARGDTRVWDEPFYPCYLQRTRPDHPATTRIVERHEADPAAVAARIAAPAEADVALLYMKQRTKYVSPEHDDLSWISKTSHAFLIRDPRATLAAISQKGVRPTLEDTGLIEQSALFRRVREELGAVPAVVDHDDLLRNPRRILRALCGAVGVHFTDRMLSWAPGPRETDGVWGAEAYQFAADCDRFDSWVADPDTLTSDLLPLYEACGEHYRQMFDHRLGDPP